MARHEIPPIVYTHAAQTHAAAHGSQAGLEAETVKELRELSEDGEHDLRKLIFHSFSYGGFYNMVTFPKDGVMVVDYSETVEVSVLKEGPFKGKTVTYPQPFTVDED